MVGTTSVPERFTRARTLSAVPSTVTMSWSSSHARAVSSAWSSSVAPAYGSSGVGRPIVRERPVARTMPATNGSLMATVVSGDRRHLRAAAGHDLGEDRQRDLARRAGADVETGGRVHARAVGVVDVEVGDDGLAALAAGHERDVRDPGLERGGERAVLVAAV